jgi:hypothetical protein
VCDSLSDCSRTPARRRLTYLQLLCRPLAGARLFQCFGSSCCCGEPCDAQLSAAVGEPNRTGGDGTSVGTGRHAPAETPYRTDARTRGPRAFVPTEAFLRRGFACVRSDFARTLRCQVCKLCLQWSRSRKSPRSLCSSSRALVLSAAEPQHATVQRRSCSSDRNVPGAHRDACVTMCCRPVAYLAIKVIAPAAHAASQQ